jgi:ribonucleoside-diphosphate reductase alpha chain
MLQYGVPLDVLVNKFSHTRFEPSGFTNNPKIPIAKSILDYIFRWLSVKFLEKEDVAPGSSLARNEVTQAATAALSAPASPIPRPEISAPAGPALTLDEPAEKTEEATPPSGWSLSDPAGLAHEPDIDSPPCSECGSIMIRNGACHKCINCGATSGCS